LLLLLLYAAEDRQTDRHIDARDHNKLTFRVVYDLRDMQWRIVACLVYCISNEKSTTISVDKDGWHTAIWEIAYSITSYTTI